MLLTQARQNQKCYRPDCVIDAVCPAIVTSVDRCAPVFAGMNSST